VIKKQSVRGKKEERPTTEEQKVLTAREGKREGYL